MQYYDNYVQRPRKRPLAAEERRTATPTFEHVAPAAHAMVAADTNKREYMKLGGVFAFIAICATIMSVTIGFDFQMWMEWFMGGFFVIFGSFKLIGYEAFIATFPQYDPIGRRFRYYTLLYPFIQLFLGFTYVANIMPIPRDLVTLTIYTISAYGIMKYLSSNSQTIQCACLGNFIKLPLSRVSLIEDMLMVGMSVIMLITYIAFFFFLGNMYYEKYYC